MAFELPMAYIYSDKFNQPIFGANNLSGELQRRLCPDVQAQKLNLCKLSRTSVPACLVTL